jgi:hypothetical protein
MKSIRKKIKRKHPKNKTKCHKHKHNKHFFCPYCNKMMKGGCSCGTGTGGMLGGNDVAQTLSYTGNTPHYDKNPYLAYTGKTDTNVIYPDVTGPPVIKMDWLNSLKSGGGGGGINYPNGLIGNDWNPNYQYPNVSGTTNNNHYKLNTYAPNDISRDTILSGASKPFSIGGKKRRSKTRKPTRSNTQKRKIGGYLGTTFSILDNVSYNLGKYTSNLQGLNEPPDPLPFQDQLKGSLNNLKNYR